jgi:hypothetical protein
MSKELFTSERETRLIAETQKQEIEFTNRQIELKHGTLPHSPSAPQPNSGN